MNIQILPLLLCIGFLITASHACQSNHHCNDNDPTTDDICLKGARMCLNIPTLNSATRQSSVAVPTTLTETIRETNAARLSFAQKLTIIRAARRVLAQVNPHRFIHLNIYKADPVAELDKFEEEISYSTSNFEFHERMTKIFESMNDFHTGYRRPAPLNMTFTVIGFSIKEFFKEGSRKPNYVVDGIIPRYLPNNSRIDIGAEVLSVNGMGVEKVLINIGKQSSASNRAAQKAFGAFQLTLRSLGFTSPPSRSSMSVRFRNSKGREFTETYPWVFVKVVERSMAAAITSSMHGGSSGDPLIGDPLIGDEEDQEAEFHIKRSARLTHENMHSVRLATTNRKTVPVSEKFEGVFFAEIIETSKGKIGMVNIRSFTPGNATVVNELSRLVKLMPKRGLVIDIRGNPGGFYHIARAFSQVLSGKDIPLRLRELRATSEVISFLKAIRRAGAGLFASSFLPAAKSANRAKEFFSGPAFDRTGAFLPVQDRAYFGPYVTVTDGLTYSAGDLFASVQKDEELSLVVGTESNTGAGGANVLRYNTIRSFLPSMFPALSDGIGFTTAFGRTFRTGKTFGAILEYFGVKPDARYFLSKNDILNDDCDLIEFLARKLDEMN